MDFLSRLIEIIKSANSIDEIEFYLPLKKIKISKKQKKMEPYQSFFIDGYKIMLGRNERENNIYLLENSKANDFWFHLQESFCPCDCTKYEKELPEYIIEEASKICARFSSDSKGSFCC